MVSDTLLADAPMGTPTVTAEMAETADGSTSAADGTHRRPRARAVPLSAVLLAFATLALAILSLTPAYEANDEPDHMRNVQLLVSGQWYRIGPGGGYEPHQPPLYYLGLAGLQKALSLPPSFQDTEGSLGTLADGLYEHEHGDAQRRYALLRLPSIVLGLVTVYLTFRIGLLAGLRRQHAIAAAALTAFIPRFTFLSSVVNNDNLAAALGSLVIFLGFQCVNHVRAGRRPSTAQLVALGVAAGASLLTKLSVAPVLLAVAAVVVWEARRSGQLRRLMVAGAVAVVVSAPIFVSNQVRYGDPLAARQSVEQFKPWVPSLVDVNHSANWYVQKVGAGFLHSFWYTSGLNQFRWRAIMYVPFWGLALVGIIGAFVGPRLWRGHQPDKEETLAMANSGVTAARLLVVWLAGVSAVWILATSTTQWQARVSYPSLSAFSVLVMLGYRRLRLPRWAMWVLPALCLFGVVYAIRTDIIARYFFEVPEITG